jgi:phage gpG-like protein
MTARVTVTDRGADGLLSRLRRAAGARVRVGVLEEATKATREEEGSPLTLLEVAAIHEFGAPAAGIPQRSFIRAGVDAQLPEIQRVQRALAGQTIRGATTLDVALDRLGAKVAALLQNRISAGIDPPNSAATIARKGSSKPLVDTGQLKASITWRVLS